MRSVFHDFYTTLYNLHPVSPSVLDTDKITTIAASLREALMEEEIDSLSQPISSEEFAMEIACSPMSKPQGLLALQCLTIKLTSRVPFHVSLQCHSRGSCHARITVIHKKCKNPLYCASYRLILFV